MPANKNNVTKRSSLDRPLNYAEGDKNTQELINVIGDQQSTQSSLNEHLEGTGNVHPQYETTVSVDEKLEPISTQLAGLGTASTADSSEFASSVHNHDLLYYRKEDVDTAVGTAEQNAKTYTDNELLALIDAAPDAINTLNELAAALGDDPNFATTVTNQIASKLNSSVYTAADVLSKLLTVDENGSGINATTIDGLETDIFDNLSNRAISTTQVIDPAIGGTYIVDNSSAVTLGLNISPNSFPGFADSRSYTVSVLVEGSAGVTWEDPVNWSDNTVPIQGDTWTLYVLTWIPGKGWYGSLGGKA